jgi:hypothetical protein
MDGDWAQTSMRAVPVVVVHPGLEFALAFGGVLVEAEIGPFAQRGLDEALGLAVGAPAGGNVSTFVAGMRVSRVNCHRREYTMALACVQSHRHCRTARADVKAG